jgi:hypothetical protein
MKEPFVLDIVVFLELIAKLFSLGMDIQGCEYGRASCFSREISNVIFEGTA